MFFVYQYDRKMDHILEKQREFAIADGYTGLYIILGPGSPPEYLKDMSTIVGYQAKKLQLQRLDSLPSGKLVNLTLTYPYPSDYLNDLSLPKWCQAVSVNGNNDQNSETQKEMPPLYPQFESNKPEIYGVPVTFDNTPRREFKTANQWNYGKSNVVVENFWNRLETMLTFDSCCWRSNINSTWSKSSSGQDRDYQMRFLWLMHGMNGPKECHWSPVMFMDIAF